MTGHPDNATADRERQIHRRAVASIVRLRKQRGWTAADLIDELARIAPGLSLSRSVLANLEAGRREHLTITELAAFAEALQVDPWSLTADAPPICLACTNEPPYGYMCLTCHACNPSKDDKEPADAA